MGVNFLKEYNTKDTIAAIATASGPSALGVIRLSGREALNIISSIFKPARKKNIRKAKTFTLHYGWIVDKHNRGKKKPVVVDEVVLGIMRRPHTYTTEDIVEISCHGGAVIIQRILELLLQQGARLAERGEFTYRALCAGRINLIQAESISGIVEAKTQYAAELAVLQLNNESFATVTKLQADLKELFVQTEAQIAFPDDEIPVNRTRFSQSLKRIISSFAVLISAGKQAQSIREGLRCVIAGRTNVGKSTLFNCLLRKERVIVSRVAGTTRDVIEDIISIGGVPVRIYDTAGILEPKDLVTKKALQKTKAIFDEADLIILVVDCSRPLKRGDLFLLEKSRNKNIIIVANKIDLSQRLDFGPLRTISSTIVKMSALHARGLKALEKAVQAVVYQDTGKSHEALFLSLRQRQLLKDAGDIAIRTQAFVKEGQTLDIINFSLKNCLDTVGKLTGHIQSDEILEDIFTKFCIGK